MERDRVTCPYCGDTFTENFQYGPGAGNWNKMSLNQCDRCGSYEHPHPHHGVNPWEFKTQWAGPLAGDWTEAPDWILDLAHNMFELGVAHGAYWSPRPGDSPADSLAPALSANAPG